MNGIAVLCVEDDPLSRRVMHMVLTGRMGLTHVTILKDSADFHTRITTIDPVPDIILLDIHLGPYNGFQMFDIIRKTDRFANVPVVALTASVMNEEVAQLREAGFQSIIAKPIDLGSFPDMLYRILKGESFWRITE